MKAPEICTCAVCRRTIRRQVAAAFRERRRWLGYWTLKTIARLGWVPEPFYRSVLQEMLDLGLLIRVHDPEGPFTQYMLSALTLASLRKGAAR